MPYRISDVQYSEFPAEGAVESAVEKLGLSFMELIGAFRDYVCPAVPQAGRGYQMDVADHLERYLSDRLRRDGLRSTRSRYDLTYSPALNQHADFGLVHEATKKRILFEIEFRPNYEKDLIKFQIGANRGLLALGVMVVAIDRKSINASYTTMPEYASIAKVIHELAPSYPLLLVGLIGGHSD